MRFHFPANATTKPARDKNSSEYCNEKELGSKDTELENLESNSSVARDCISIDTSTTSLANESDVSNPDVVIHEASSLSNDAVPITNKVNPLCSDYFLQAVPDNQRELVPVIPYLLVPMQIIILTAL